jgi:serine/threonine protein kinase
MFSEHYSVCLNDDGSPREIRHIGPVVTYKAMGYESGRTVAMQLIPLASLGEGERVRLEEGAQAARKVDHSNIARVFDIGAEDDHLVFVSEYFEGESAEEWIDEHGPMAPDAVLRIGFQIATALAAAEELGVAPHSIQPANVIIVPGVAADGGWPGIKIRNFGLPAVKLNSDNGETRELVPSMPPQFASPEQRDNETLDVRSDIFSLGATLWFLLTGSAPPLPESNESAPRLLAPDIPRFVRNLVSTMLRTAPEERPQEPGALAARFRAALQKVERKTAFSRSFAPAAMPGTTKPQRRRSAPALALAAALIALAALAAFVLPQRFANRQHKPLGVLIGVPETSPISQSSVAPAAAAQPPIVAQQSIAPPAMRADSPEGAGSASPSADTVSSSTQLADNNRIAEPPRAPAEGPSESDQSLIGSEPQPSAEKSESSSSPSDVPTNVEPPKTDSSSTAAEKANRQNSSENVKNRNDSRASKRKSRHQRIARSSVPHARAPLRVGSESARFVGTTPRGNWVLRLPSGETVIAPPVPDLADAPVVTPRHIRRVERPVPLQDESPIVVLPPD